MKRGNGCKCLGEKPLEEVNDAVNDGLEEANRIILSLGGEVIPGGFDILQKLASFADQFVAKPAQGILLVLSKFNLRELVHEILDFLDVVLGQDAV